MTIQNTQSEKTCRTCGYGFRPYQDIICIRENVETTGMHMLDEDFSCDNWAARPNAKSNDTEEIRMGTMKGMRFLFKFGILLCSLPIFLILSIWEYVSFSFKSNPSFAWGILGHYIRELKAQLTVWLYN